MENIDDFGCIFFHISDISLEKNSLSSPLDSAILIDAIIAGLADPTKEICHYAVVLFTFMKEIALASLGDIEKVIIYISRIKK